MVESGLVLSPAKYYEEAKIMLEKKDLLGFMLKIGVAIEASANDKEMLANSTFLKCKGLVNFNQFGALLDSIDDALKYNTGENAFRLKKYKGVALGYLGEFKKALIIFKDLLNETDEILLLIEAYNNIAWVNLLITTIKKDDSALQEAKKYLKLIRDNFDNIDDKKRQRYFNNYSTYFSFIGEYDKAIGMQKRALDYCQEADLPKIYNNLAALYLNFDKEELSVDAIDYLEKAEVISNKNGNKFEMAKSMYTKALYELREEQYFRALDTLYLAFEFFRDAEAYSNSFDTLIKINEVISEYKIDCLSAMSEGLKNKLKGTPFFE